jgi:dihydrofolate reductase
MAELSYSVMTSLDGYINDENGRFDWAEPDTEVHQLANDLMRPITTHLYGRRMYEMMVAWETMGTQPDDPAVEREFAELWRAADKIVYSSTLTEVSSARTRIERRFDADAVRALTARATGDLVIGGPTLAAHAFAAGLVDRIHQFINPIVVGAGTSAWTPGVRLPLELVETRRFGKVVYVQHRVQR